MGIVQVSDDKDILAAWDFSKPQNNYNYLFPPLTPAPPPPPPFPGALNTNPLWKTCNPAWKKHHPTGLALIQGCM